MRITLTPDSQTKFARLLREHADAVIVRNEAEADVIDTRDTLSDFVTEKINEAYAVGKGGGWAG